MRVVVLFLAGAIGCLSASVVHAASQSRTVYQYRDWDVRQVTWDDGTSTCVAEVSYENGDAFSVWEDKTQRIRIQLYSPTWSFGSKDSYADISFQVDSQNSWSVKKADFYKNSVFVDPPNDGATSQFLSQVKFGKTLYLYDNKGKQQSYYSLTGSQASIDALSTCIGNLH